MARHLIPNTTPIPDLILDFWLSELSGAELKVVLYVARRTYGFGKQSDNISLTQLETGITKRDGSVLDKGTGLSRSSVARAVKSLEARGIILRKLNLSEVSNEHEESTYRLNLDWGRGSASGNAGGEGVVPESNQVVSRKEGRWSQNRTTGSSIMDSGVVPQSDPQETDLQETAATGGAAEIIKLLIEQGMNRECAVRLAAAKPDRCRKQLEHLAYLVRTGFKFKNSRGAFLRRAIEEGFAAPEGMLRELTQQSERSSEQARRASNQALEESKLQYLRDSMTRMKTEQPTAYNDFIRYVETTRQEAVNRSILDGTPKLRKRVGEAFDSETTRLELLEKYISESGGS